MSRQLNSYDCPEAINASLDSILDIFKEIGIEKIVYKALAPNDNSKNQIYLAGNLNEIKWLTINNLIASESTSHKTGEQQIKYTKELDFVWLDSVGNRMDAPNTKLIYYPQYPEVRLSGFIQGSQIGMNGWMNPEKNGRSENRYLIMGATNLGTIYAYLAVPNSVIALGINAYPQRPTDSAVSQLLINFGSAITSTPTLDSRSLLLNELRRIHLKGYIRGKKLRTDMTCSPYSAPNGGGYTLEAELGVIPNGDAKPDFHGWEIKQFGVKNFGAKYSKALTLLTPEPDGGEYIHNGLEYFLKTYGYPSSSKADRWDFNGTHRFGLQHQKTNLTLDLDGFDKYSRKITKADGKLSFISQNGDEAASWKFSKLMEHWTTKHSKAAYIPSLKNLGSQGEISYHFGNKLKLFEGTSFELFLGAFVDDLLYLDPAHKIENITTTKRPQKKRNQFRVKWQNLEKLYLTAADVTL